MKFWMTLLAACLVLTMTAAIQAKSVAPANNKKKAPAKPQTLKGSISFISADGWRFWITTKSTDGNGNEQDVVTLVVTDANTEITLKKAKKPTVSNLGPSEMR